jgi:peroxiredoxin
MSLTYSAMMELGTRAPDFALTATDGKTYSLASFADCSALLVVFYCNHCPYAQAVEDRLIRLGHDYIPKGLGMILISSNDVSQYPEDSFEEMCRRAEDKDYPFPYAYDESQSVAHAYHAACTPDPFVFDAERRLFYRGRIDDNWKEPSKVKRQDLRAAIEAVLLGRPMPAEQLASLGCNIKWKTFHPAEHA